MSKQELIPLKPVEAHEIESTDPNLLWMISIHDEKCGPFHFSQIQAFAAEHSEIIKDISVKKYQAENWIKFFDEPSFQRRKPQLMSSQAFVSQDSFFVLINGVKKGPYTGDKVRSMLASHEIIVSDQISVDNGNSWIKLYQHHEFDRRTRTNKLPHAIKESFFIPKEAVTSEVEEVLTGLVFETKKENFEQSSSPSNHSGFNKKLWISLGASVIVIALFALPKSKQEQITQTGIIEKSEPTKLSENSKPDITARRPASVESRMRNYPKSEPGRAARNMLQNRRRNVEKHHDQPEIVDTEPKDEYGYQDAPQEENMYPENPIPDPAEREVASEPHMESEVQEIKEEMMEEISEMRAEELPVEDVNQFQDN